MRKLRADAAQRRIEVTQGCASGTDESTELAEEASRNGFRTKAEEEDANEQAIMQAFIELIQEEEREKYGSSYVPPSQENPAGPQTETSPGPLGPHDRAPVLPRAEKPQVEDDLTRNADNSSYEAPWTCPTCTLENPASFLCCDACAAERPPPTKDKHVDLTQRPNPSANQRPEGPKPEKRPLPADPPDAKDEPTPRDTFSFKNRRRALDSLTSLDSDVNKKPLGWICSSCKSFMETQWWTCSCCGKMKPSS